MAIRKLKPAEPSAIKKAQARKKKPAAKKAASRDEDVASRRAPKPAESPETATELVISIQGQVTSSNFPQWKKALLAKIASADRELKTDEDFIVAETAVSDLRGAEKSLANAKQKAIDEAEQITKLFSEIDEISVECARTRLNLDRQIKAKKEEIKQDLVAAGIKAVGVVVDAQGSDFDAVSTTLFQQREFIDAIKGRRTIETMDKAISDLVGDITVRITKEAERIAANRVRIDAIEPELKPLFQDEAFLLRLYREELEDEIANRIATANEAAAIAAAKKTAEENERDEIRDAPADPFIAETAQDTPQPRGFVSKSQAKRINAQKAEDYRITISLRCGRDDAIGWCRTVTAWTQDAEIPHASVKLGRVKK